MNKKSKKNDAVHAQVEDLGREDGTGASAGEGPATESGTPAAGTDEVGAVAAAPIADDTAGADAGVDGDAPAGADVGNDQAEEEDGGLADELDDDLPLNAFDDTDEHRHVPADYEVDAPFKAGDRVFLVGSQQVGTVSEIRPTQMAEVRWGDGSESLQHFETISPMQTEHGETGQVALAAYAAGYIVLSGSVPENFELPAGFLECAAGFVRDNPDVDAAVIPVHLKLKGFRTDIPIQPREVACWTVFRAALKAIETCNATEKAELEAIERAAEAKRQPSGSRDRLSFVPQDRAFSPTGFTPSR